MSLPTGGMSSSASASMNNMLTQARQQDLQQHELPIMDLRAVSNSRQHGGGHPFVMNAQTVSMFRLRSPHLVDSPHFPQSPPSPNFVVNSQAMLNRLRRPHLVDSPHFPQSPPSPHFVMNAQTAGMLRLPSPHLMVSAGGGDTRPSKASLCDSLLTGGGSTMSSAGHMNVNGSAASTLSPQHTVSDSNNTGGGMTSPYSNIVVKQEMGGGGGGNQQSPIQFPQLSSTVPSQLGGLSNPFSVHSSQAVSKHICAVCGDRASGKHYGVYSCEGCKGFFKRTVRKFLTYTCRDEKDCIIDKRQRNRCQYCRYQKCLSMGMKKEAVQDERQKNREADEMMGENATYEDMPVEKILEAELASDPKVEDIVNFQESADAEATVCKAADHQLYTLVEWAKRVPQFSSLALDDQVTLLRAGWNELLIASFSHRSINHPDAIVLSIGLRVYRQSAHAAGVGVIFDRVLTELIAKMKQMSMDRTELGCLRAIVLFNPDAKELNDPGCVESLREKVYAALEVYCKSKYPDQTGRFAKLLLRLPALRSIGLKCLEHLFFFKLIGNTPIDQFIMDKLAYDGQAGGSPVTSSSSSSSGFASNPLL